jgi:hypothetical protein
LTDDAAKRGVPIVAVSAQRTAFKRDAAEQAYFKAASSL